MSTPEVVFTVHPRPNSDDPAMRDILDLPRIGAGRFC